MTDSGNEQHIELVKRMLVEMLEQQRIDKVSEYFTDDAVLMINETVLNGREEISQRLAWIRDNKPDIKVTIKCVFFSGDEGFDHHESATTNEQGEPILFKIFGYIQMRDGKVCRYEDVTLQIEGAGDMAVATSTQA